MRIEIDPAVTESLATLSTAYESVKLEIRRCGYLIALEFRDGMFKSGGIDRLVFSGPALPIPVDGHMESVDPMVIVINEDLNG